jgi:hypothetical protein
VVGEASSQLDAGFARDPTTGVADCDRERLTDAEAFVRGAAADAAPERSASVDRIGPPKTPDPDGPIAIDAPCIGKITLYESGKIHREP